MARSNKQKDIRKLKYDLVIQVTGSVKEARRARDLGANKLFTEYGVELPKRQTKPRQVKQATINKRKREARRAKQLIEAGVSIKEAKTLKRRSNVFVQNYIAKIYKPSKVGKIPERFIDTAESTFKRFGKSSEIDRVTQWSEWSKKDSEYPQSIALLAKKLNRAEGYDDEAHYGWAVVNQAYVKNISIEEALANHVPYQNYGGEIYERVEKITA